MLSVEQLCHKVVRATSSHRLNFLTIGVPGALIPQEALDAGVVVLAPGQRRDLTFRIPAGEDVFVTSMGVYLYLVEGAAPNQTLTPVPSGANGLIDPVLTPIQADVRISIFDAAARREANDQEMDWSLFAGRARYQTYVQPTFPMMSSRPYIVRVRSYELSDTFAVAIVLNVRRRRAQNPAYGWSLDDTKLVNRLMGEAQIRGELNYGEALSQDDQKNVSCVGRYKTIHVNGVQGDDDAPITLAAGTFNNPNPIPFGVSGMDRYAFVAQQLMCRQSIAGEGATGFAIPDAPLPVFVHPFDREAQFWYSNGPVPLNAIFGDGGRPFILDPAWAWGRNADIIFNLANYHDEDLLLYLDIEGYWRDTRVC